MRTIIGAVMLVFGVVGTLAGYNGGQGHNGGSGGGYNGGFGDVGGQGVGFGGGGIGGGGAMRFVSVHVPPAQFEGPRRPAGGPRVVYAATGPRDTNYNIIFVRAPTPPPPQQTQVILPQPPEQKTLVYVLVRKPDVENPIKFRHPKPVHPGKPEVYFVTYKGGNGIGQSGGGGAGIGGGHGNGGASGNGGGLSGDYGAPAVEYGPPGGGLGDGGLDSGYGVPAGSDSGQSGGYSDRSLGGASGGYSGGSFAVPAVSGGYL